MQPARRVEVDKPVLAIDLVRPEIQARLGAVCRVERDQRPLERQLRSEAIYEACEVVATTGKGLMGA